MASLQFNTAPNESSEDGINELVAGTINDMTTGGTATAGQGRTPKRLRFVLEPSHAQAMMITPGTQQDKEDPTDKGGSQGEDTRGTSETDKGNDPYGTEINGNGPFVKICKGMCADINQEMAARVTREAFESMSEEEIGLELRIHVVSEQLAPFPLLAITASNHVVVLHGIRRLVVPLVKKHSLKNQVLAFIGDAMEVSGFPTVVKLDEEDFEPRKNWSHPKVDDIMNVIEEETQVLPVSESKDTVETSKLIPIPLFLVSTFLDAGRQMDVIEAYQVFFDEFFDKAPKQMREDTKFILNFLMAATGYKEGQAQGPDKVSQLAISMEELPLDDIISHWASAQFGGIRHIIDLQEETTKLVNWQYDNDVYNDQVDQPQEQPIAVEGEDMQNRGNRSSVDAVRGSRGDTTNTHKDQHVSAIARTNISEIRASNVPNMPQVA